MNNIDTLDLKSSKDIILNVFKYCNSITNSIDIQTFNYHRKNLLHINENDISRIKEV